MRLLWTINETADCLSIGRTLVYQLVQSGDLKLVKIGFRSLITDDSIKAYVAKIAGVEIAVAQRDASVPIAPPSVAHRARTKAPAPRAPHVEKIRVSTDAGGAMDKLSEEEAADGR